MIRSKPLSRLLMALLVAGCVCTVPFSSARAEADAEDAGFIKGVMDSIANETSRRNEVMNQLFEVAGSKFETSIMSVKNVLVDLQEHKIAEQGEPMPYVEKFRPILVNAVISRNLMEEIQKKLDEVSRETLQGNAKVDSNSTSTDENAATSSMYRYDTFIYNLMDSIFCNPEEAGASDECKKKSAEKVKPTDYFVEFFTGEKTWTDQMMIDAMAVARRMFAGTKNRITLGYDTDQEKFAVSQAPIAQTNLRMAILHDLAARRAPSSRDAKHVLGMLLEIMSSSTSSVQSTSPDFACKIENMAIKKGDSDAVMKAKAINTYVCSHATAPLEDGARLISQAAIDKVTQYTFYMSPNFYNEVNSYYNGNASLERMEAFMKAQQVAQDYRALRLLQMKTAGLAVRLINP